MGQYTIEIDAFGNHGCDRQKKDGEDVYGCRSMHCPDCRARELVETLKRTGSTINSATLTHWPGTAGEVQDDLLTGKRKGGF